MKKRWRIYCSDLNGETIAETRFVFRRNAVKYGRALRSPFYDVVLERVDGTYREVLSILVPPDEYVASLRAR